MKAKIQAEIDRLDNYVLVHPGTEPKQNLRSAYEVALLLDGLPFDYEEKPADMLQRAGQFIFDYLSVVSNIQAKLFEDLGLSGDVTGGFKLGYLKNLETDEAAAITKITVACHAAELLKIDLETITAQIFPQCETCGDKGMVGGSGFGRIPEPDGMPCPDCSLTRDNGENK